MTVTQTNGAVLEGIFHTFTPFSGIPVDMKNKYVLNTVKTVKLPTSGENEIEDGSTVIIPVEKVKYVHARNISLERTSANGGSTLSGKGKNDVMTDTQISGGRVKKHDLVAAGNAWTAGGGKSHAGGLVGALEEKSGMTRKGFGLATNSKLQGNIGEWDQFKANQELFNVNATFDENLYTTELDKSQIDSKKIAEAERIAREIEKTASTNIHIAEERGHILETDFDEEDRYSGVLTKEGKQRHQASSSKDDAEESKGFPAATPAAIPKKVMNYAAAAAKADGGKWAAPPGFTTKTPVPASTPEPKVTEKSNRATPEKDTDAETKSKEAAEAKKDPPATAEESTAEASKVSQESEQSKKEDDEKKEKTEAEPGDGAEKAENNKKETKNVAKTSKLNANAKAFTFNPSAKSFTPSFGQNTNFTPQNNKPPQPPQHADSNNGMQLHTGGHPMHPPPYMHTSPMGQPGMMPMMSPQYPGMRYPSHQFAGVDQHVAQTQIQQQAHQPQHTQASKSPAPVSTQSSAPTSAPVTGSSEDESTQQQAQESDASQQSQQEQQSQPPQQQQQQQMPMQYGAYFTGSGMPMHTRPGYPYVGNPQQIPVRPGGTPYAHMYPMQSSAMAPNMHMRGPGGTPYYPGPGGGPMPNYPPGGYHGHGIMDENDPGFRGRGGRGPGGRGRGRRGGRGRGPTGRGGYQQNYGGQSSGRSTPQQQQVGGSEQSGTLEEGANPNAETQQADTSNTSS